MNEILYHNIEPVYYKDSQILILGSFPSPKSRDVGFFYGNPQNRFWPMLSAVFSYPAPTSVEEKKLLLKNFRIALWDVVSSCSIRGASDSSLRCYNCNDISQILNQAQIRRILFNGKTAYNLFLKNNKMVSGNTEIQVLPSTSPANAQYSLQKLITVWQPFLTNQ